MYGMQISKRARKVSAAVIERYRPLPVANVSDCMSRIVAGGARLRPLHRGGKLVGPALTVKTRPGDNLFIHKALDLAEPGDVIVVDGGGDLTNSLMGELMVAHAKVRGVAGIVLYGAVRDIAAIRASNWPVYATGVSHRGPYKDGPGEINVPIAIEGMVIEPGDLIIGDEDGVLCVPFAQTQTVYEATVKKHAAEEKKMQAILEGRDDRSWVDASLNRLGCVTVV